MIRPIEIREYEHIYRKSSQNGNVKIPDADFKALQDYCDKLYDENVYTA